MTDPRETITRLRDVLSHTKLFLRNGIALGYIVMPDPQLGDPASRLPAEVDKALAALDALLRASRAQRLEDVEAENARLQANSAVPIQACSADVTDQQKKDLHTIVAHPFLALAREHAWSDEQLAAARKLIDVTVIRLEERAAVPSWLVDALNGLIGLIQLLPDERRRDLIDSHRYLDAVTASNRIATGANGQ